MTMQEILGVFPGAQRALFSRYHVGGCSSCGFQPAELLTQARCPSPEADPGKSRQKQSEMLIATKLHSTQRGTLK